MTILTNTQIQALVSSNQLISHFDSDRLQPASYDLRIGTIFRNGQIINSTHSLGSSPIVIQPGEVVTMLTKEELHLPDDVAGTAYAMNSQSSEGLLVLNPGHVDPGYKGPLSMVALNLRRVALPLCLDEPIFTMVFDQLNQAAAPAYRSSTSNRRDRELKTNKKVIEKSMVSIGDLISINSPFVTEKRVEELVLKHWLSWVVLIATLVAAIFSVLAVVLPIVQARFQSPTTASTATEPTKLHTQDTQLNSISAAPVSAETKFPPDVDAADQHSTFGEISTRHPKAQTSTLKSNQTNDQVATPSLANKP